MTEPVISLEKINQRLALLSASKQEHEMFRDRFWELANRWWSFSSQEDRELIRVEQAIDALMKYGRQHYGDIP